ncbi:MAG: hypothetical protein ACR2P2_07720 [Nakamurella sp.]
MLLLADRNFYSHSLWGKAIATGADLLWRVKTGLRPVHLLIMMPGQPRALPAVHHDHRPGGGLGHQGAFPLTPTPPTASGKAS